MYLILKQRQRFFDSKPTSFWTLAGTVQWELRGVKIGINRSLMMHSLAGKCPLPCPKGHLHERSINVFSGFSTFGMASKSTKAAENVYETLMMVSIGAW